MIPKKLFENSFVFQQWQTSNPLNKHNVTTFFMEILSLPEKAIIIFSEIEDNEGMSVTNSVEYLATDVYQNFLSEYFPKQIIWVEHYPESAYRNIKIKISYSLVTLEWNKLTKAFYFPQWKHIKTIEEVKELAI